MPSCVLGTSILHLGLRKSLSLYALNTQMSDTTQDLKLKSGCHCKYRTSALQVMAEAGNNYSNHCWIAGMCQEQPCWGSEITCLLKPSATDTPCERPLFWSVHVPWRLFNLLSLENWQYPAYWISLSSKEEQTHIPWNLTTIIYLYQNFHTQTTPCLRNEKNIYPRQTTCGCPRHLLQSLPTKTKQTLTCLM